MSATISVIRFIPEDLGAGEAVDAIAECGIDSYPAKPWGYGNGAYTKRCLVEVSVEEVEE